MSGFTTLTSDPTLMALLPGGLYDANVVGEVARTTTPAAFDPYGELTPCGLYKPTSDQRAGPLPTSSRRSVTLYLYERSGTTAIEAARLRIYTLLHRVRLAPASGGAWEWLHGEDILNQYDTALRAALIVCRYAVYLRKG